ncbi:Aspartate/glutamate/uridylate kinase [Amylostereum chailletii]|nr:Aspartate/glutamate/uridylate kinase [Amylostereum chailletii]
MAQTVSSSELELDADPARPTSSRSTTPSPHTPAPASPPPSSPPPLSSSRTPSPSSSLSSRATPSPPRTPPNLHQNSIDPAAQWLVQKYGGTSVGKFAAKIAREIVPQYLDQHKLAIVCSARSGSTKALGTTNLLLRAASEALRRPSVSGPSPSTNGPFSTPGSPTRSGVMTPMTSALFTRSRSGSGSPRDDGDSGRGGAPFAATVDTIRREHVTAARAAVRDAALLQELEDEIGRDCEGLRGFLYATQVIDEISPRSKDSIVGFGEKLACKIMVAALRDQGIDAEFVSLDGVVPPHEDESGGALGQAFYDQVSVAFAERVEQCGPRVPVVTGFFGPVPGSLLRQVGRGYTDLAAALLAAGLAASELQIWKEVDGIFTADPRKVPTARLIPMISPEEAAELTYYGSEVVHPFTMEQVIRKKIPIRIKNVENPLGGGTVIHPDHDSDTTSAAGAELVDALALDGAGVSLGGGLIDPHQLALTFADGIEQRAPRRKLPTAVTIKERIVVLNVQSNRKSVSHGFLAGIFGTLDRFGVVVDLISTSEVYVSMAIEDVLDKKYLARVVRELEKIGTVSVHHEMAILSLVGKQMRNLVGIAGRFFGTLAQGNVNIEMISQGANEINISCVIDARDAVKALNLIHQSCLQIKPEGPKGRVGPWLF